MLFPRELAVPERRCYLADKLKIQALECSRCQLNISADKPQTICPQRAGVLYVRSDLSGLRGIANRKQNLTGS